MTDATRLIGNANIAITNIAEVDPHTIECLQQAPRIYFDTETTAFHPWNGGEIALTQFYDPESKQVVLGRVAEHQAPPEWVLDLFSKGKTFIGHNITGFDLVFLNEWGVPWKKSNYFDTLVAECLITTSGRRDMSRSLRGSVKRRTGYEVNKDIEHGNWRAGEMSARQIEYAAIDVLALPGLYQEQLEKADSTNQTNALNMEMEVAPVFTSMKINGLPIDRDNLDLYMEQQRVKIAEAEKLLKSRLGNINFNSHPQLKKALATAGIELDSTAKAVLIDTILFDPETDNAKLLQALLDWRAPHKRTEMYGSEDWMAENVQPDGRIHSSFWQVGADTTRVSSSDPNLQQVPKDGRWIFGNLPGHKIVSVDYSQIEVRIAASISNDLELFKALAESDVHTAVASSVFKIPPEKVTKGQRKLAKAMVFTLLFGGSAKVLYEYARRSGSQMTMEEAIELFLAFFEAFQGLKRMRQMAYAITKNRRVAVITLPNGARRVLAGAKMSPQIILNTPVQGTAAVGMKLGLIEAKKQGLEEYMCAVVHDETVSCVPEPLAEDYAKHMQACLIAGMSKVLTNCPVKAEIGRTAEGELPNVWLP